MSLPNSPACEAGVPVRDAWNEGEWWKTVIALFSLAFLVRLVGLALALALIPRFLVADDTSSLYYPIARSVAAGHGYQLPGDPYTATRAAPLLPLWLAVLIRATGRAELPLWLPGVFFAAFRAAGVVWLYLLARRSFGPRAGLWAAVLYLADPWEAMWVGYLLKETIAVPLFLGAVWLTSRLADRPTPARAWAAGTLIGLSALARFPNVVLVVAAWFLIARSARRTQREGRGARLRDALVAAGHLSLALGLVLSPWLLHTWRVLGQPVMTPHFAGRQFYTSNGPGLEMVQDGYYAPGGIDHSLLDQVDRERLPIQQNRYLFLYTIRHIVSRPGEFVARTGLKFVNMWRPTFQVASLRNRLLLGAPYLALMAVSLAGAVLAARRKLPCVSLAAPLVLLFVVHLVFRGEIRNRQYLIPLICGFGGLALAVLEERLRKSKVTAPLASGPGP